MAPLTDKQRRAVARSIATAPPGRRMEAFEPIAGLLGVHAHEMETELSHVARFIPPQRFDHDLIASYRLHVHALPCSLEARLCNHFLP